MWKAKNTTDTEMTPRKIMPGSGANISYFSFLIFHFSFLLILSCGKAKKSEQQIFRYNEVSGISSSGSGFCKKSIGDMGYTSVV